MKRCGSKFRIWNNVALCNSAGTHTVDTTDPGQVAFAFIKDVAKKDINSALMLVVPDERDKARKDLVPPLPLWPYELRIKILLNTNFDGLEKSPSYRFRWLRKKLVYKAWCSGLVADHTEGMSAASPLRHNAVDRLFSTPSTLAY